MTTSELKLKAKDLRTQIIKMEYRARRGHLSSCLSIVEILTALYWEVLNIDPKEPDMENRDRFILSKGHAAKALYAILALRKFFPKNDLLSYGIDGTFLGVHPYHDVLPGVEVSTGSLGQGLSIAAGFSLSAKLNGQKYRSFVLMGDGECNEGSVWECALFSSHNKLDNLVAIIDYNKFQAFGETNKVANLEPFAAKWKSFGWGVVEIEGHSFPQLISSLKKIPLQKNKPTVIIAHTISGKGISFMENKLEWHYSNISQEQYKKALQELKT